MDGCIGCSPLLGFIGRLALKASPFFLSLFLWFHLHLHITTIFLAFCFAWHCCIIIIIRTTTIAFIGYGHVHICRSYYASIGRPRTNCKEVARFYAMRTMNFSNPNHEHVQ